MFEECPFCHKLFAAEQISKEEVDSKTEDMLKDPPRIAQRRLYARLRVDPLFQPTPVDFYTTYKLVYKCKHCEKEWTKTETEVKEVSRRVAGTEQALDADVEREEYVDEEEHHEEGN